jgi:hypothetical protein
MEYKPGIQNLDDNNSFLEYENKVYQEQLEAKNSEIRILNLRTKEVARMMRQNQPGNLIENTQVVK